MNIGEIIEGCRILDYEVINDLNNKDVEFLNSKYINVVKHSSSTVGAKLAIGHPRRFESVIGTCGSLRNSIDYIRTENYPRELLSVTRLNKKQINRIPTRKRRIDNFISAVATLLYDSISSDPELVEEIRNTDGVMVSYNRHLRKSLGTEITVFEYNSKLAYYTFILRIYSYMIKHDMFTPEYIIRVVEYLKVNKDVSAFHGTDVSIK